MKRVLSVVVVLVLFSLSVFAGEYLMNDTGVTVYGLTVTFSEPVTITGFGDVLTSVEPAGKSDTFIFLGGVLDAWDGHWLSWEPASAQLTGQVWFFTEAEVSASRTSAGAQGTGPNARPEYGDVIGATFERERGDGVGADNLIPNLGIQSEDLQLRHTTFLELLLRSTGNELEAIRNPDAIVGLADTLHHGWGDEISVYIGSDTHGMSQWVEEVVDEINAGMSRALFRNVHTGAAMRFEYSAVDYRNDREISADFTLSPSGDPVICVFRVSGLFVYEDDFKTRLRRAITNALLLYEDYDPALIPLIGRDSVNFEITTFSEDLFNILSVLRQLPNGRDFSLDKNEVNRSPIARCAKTMDAFVGDEIGLDASASTDPNGEVVSYSWRQVFPSKLDLQYRTNHIVALSSPSAAVTTFRAEWPGDYCFLLTVVDDAGASSELEVNVEVAFREAPFDIEGVSTFAYWDRSGLYTYVPERIDAFANTDNAGWVEFSPYWWMTTKTSNEVHPLGDGCAGCPGFTIRDSDLVTLIEMFHERGLKVFLRPTLEFEGWTEWRGGLQPTNWQAWFDSYMQFILHYAEIAERTGVEMMTVGVELKNSNGFTSNWRTVIQQVRTVYHGLLTYSDSELLAGLSRIEFWDDLDLIGCSGYTPITGSGSYWDTGMVPTDDPPFTAFVSSIERAYAEHVLPVHERYDMPVVVAEAGCGNYDGANQCPWCWESIADSSQDNNEQVMYFEVLLQVLSAKDWIEGVFPFVWAFKADYNWQREDWPISHDLRLGPVADLVRIWYSGEK